MRPWQCSKIWNKARGINKNFRKRHQDFISRDPIQRGRPRAYDPRPEADTLSLNLMCHWTQQISWPRMPESYSISFLFTAEGNELADGHHTLSSYKAGTLPSASGFITHWWRDQSFHFAFSHSNSLPSLFSLFCVFLTYLAHTECSPPPWSSLHNSVQLVRCVSTVV